MTIRDLHPVYLEALCVWEAFRRAGFQASEIYVGRRSPPDAYLVVGLPALKYGWRVLPPGGDPLALSSIDPGDLVRDWQMAADLWNELARRGDPELMAAWGRSDVHHRSSDFVAAMVFYGINIPCAADC